MQPRYPDYASVTPINFVFWDSKGHMHPWMPKYQRTGNLPQNLLINDPGAWVVAPGPVCGEEEAFRPTTSQRNGTLNRLLAYYRSENIPMPVITEKMNQWSAMPEHELERNAGALFTRVALVKRERALGKSEEQIAKMLGIQ